MNTLTKRQSAILCYNILMSGNDGLESKSIGYMEEKAVMIEAGYEAYGFLDSNNQGRVLLWLKIKDYAVPDPIIKYYRDMATAIIKR